MVRYTLSDYISSHDERSYSPGNPSGLVYGLNFSTVFDTSQNISSVFFNISKAPNAGAANNVGPNYSDGAMFANDFEWLIYGGMVQKTDSFTAQAANSYAVYEVYPQGASSKSTVGGFILDDLPDGMTRYITDGAAVSVPSENLGFYFAGLKSNTSGPIYEISGNLSENADTLSPTLITANLTLQQHESWANATLPDTVPGRASAEIVWVPVSEMGVLVAIGGVINPAYMTVFQSDNATQLAESVGFPFCMFLSGFYLISTALFVLATLFAYRTFSPSFYSQLHLFL